MVNELILKELGFTGFEHLSKTKRDGRRRMSWVGMLDDFLVTVLVVQNNAGWELELLKTDYEYIKVKYFSESPTIDEALKVIKDYGKLGDINP